MLGIFFVKSCDSSLFNLTFFFLRIFAPFDNVLFELCVAALVR